MNQSKRLVPKRIQVYRFLRDHKLVTAKGQIFLDLMLNKRSWENSLAKTARLVGWGDSHIQESLRELEREGLARSRRDGRKVVYELAGSPLHAA